MTRGSEGTEGKGVNEDCTCIMYRCIRNSVAGSK